MCARAQWMKFAIPLLIHGDSVPVISVWRPDSKSLECISWQSLLASGGSLATNILIFSVFEHNKLKNIGGTPDTMDVVWKVIVHSFMALFR